MDMPEKEEQQYTMEKDKEETVVIVDDEPLILMSLSEIMQKLRYKVVGTATDGFEAIDVCREKRPDIRLIDVEMPILDGFAASDCIMEENLAETIIMITAYSNEEFVNRAMEIGVAGYLVKPVSERMIMPTIRIAQARRKDIISLRQELKKSKEYIEDRKLIEKAKGIVMEKKKISENDAYEYIRKISKTRRLSMRRVAEIILRGKR